MASKNQSKSLPSSYNAKIDADTKPTGKQDVSVEASYLTELPITPAEGDTVILDNGDRQVFTNGAWIVYPTSSPQVGQ